MDPITIANAATALLLPYLARVKGTLASDVEPNPTEPAGKMWGAVQTKFQGKPAAEGAAEELATKVDDPDNQEAFLLQLKKALREDPAFADQLAALLNPGAGGEKVSNTGSGAVVTGGGVAAGTGGIAIGGNVGGSVVFGDNNTVTGEAKSENQ
jgi:poly-gamma-glutamate capsule biosynthesis protein CapA/YwtB (metallophosphatase superfamily)